MTLEPIHPANCIILEMEPRLPGASVGSDGAAVADDLRKGDEGRNDDLRRFCKPAVRGSHPRQVSSGAVWLHTAAQ